MKELIMPLEQHNIFKFHASTCPEGVKCFFEQNNYLLIRELFQKDENMDFIQKKVSNAIMKSLYISFVGKYNLICQTEGSSKVILNNGYYTLNAGDGFLYIKDLIKLKKSKKIFSKSKIQEFYLSE